MKDKGNPLALVKNDGPNNETSALGNEAIEKVYDPLHVNEERVSDLVDRIIRSRQSFQETFKNIKAVSIMAADETDSPGFD